MLRGNVTTLTSDQVSHSGILIVVNSEWNTLQKTYELNSKTSDEKTQDSDVKLTYQCVPTRQVQMTPYGWGKTCMHCYRS